MAEEQAPESKLVLDEFEEKLAAFNAFRKNDVEAADQILSEIGGSDKVDFDIAAELAAKRPLGHPERFPQAHALAVRSLEVLDRNGARGISIKNLGPLGAVVGFIVKLVTQFIVRRHQKSLAENMYHLYSRREANSDLHDPQRVHLRRARIHMERILPGFKRNPLGVPTFLFGGAILSAGGSVIVRAITSAIDSKLSRLIVIVALSLLLTSIGWVVLQGAAVARKRIKLSTDAPMRALWETIGKCGSPPKDQSKIFALLAMIFTAIAWVLPVISIIDWLL
jgi:hypothetical protein